MPRSKIRALNTFFVAGAISLTALGCANGDDPDVDVASAALISNPMQVNFVIPAYFDMADSYSWHQAASNANHGFIIVNYNSGPGTTTDSAMQGNINTVVNARDTAIGYVALQCQDANGAYHDRTADQVEADINNWHTLYQHIGGIFFDVAQRPDTSWVSGYEYYTNYAQYLYRSTRNAGGSAPLLPGWTFFNPGENGAWYQEYVDCTSQIGLVYGDEMATRWVVSEMAESDYNSTVVVNDWTTADYSWVNSYDPTHFIHLVHGVTIGGGTVATLFSTSEARNAANIYFTDRTLASNPWLTISSDGLSTPSVWTNETAEVQSIKTGATPISYPGVRPDTLTYSCPSFVRPVVAPGGCPS